MTGTTGKSSRRAFFASGGAALGAGVTSTLAGGAFAAERPEQQAPTSHQPLSQLRGLEDREAVRHLHLTFTGLIESEQYEEAAALFDEPAYLSLSGVTASSTPAIRQLLADQYRRNDVPVMHRAYRQSTLQQQADRVTVLSDGPQDVRAEAIFQVEVEVCTPLAADCTAAHMARLQGLMAERHWEAGSIEARYVKRRGRWKIASLIHRTT